MKSSSIDPIFDPKADSWLSDEALRSKRNRYVNFDAKTVIARIAKESLRANIIRIEPLGVGANAFDHLVFRAHTDKGLKVVFRLNTDAAIAEDFLIEKALYNTWYKAGIPSPEIFDVALRKKKDDPDYMLLEHVGTTDVEKHLKQYPQNEESYARASGAFLKHIHTIPVKGFGMLTLEGKELRGGHTTWREAIYVCLEETLTYLLKHKLISSKQEKEIRHAFEKNDELLTLKSGLTLHGDYHNGNIMIDEGINEVVAAIDLSQAKSGDPIYDIAFYGTYVSPKTLDAFCEGYFDQLTKPNDFEKKLALYQLRIYLSKAKLRKRFGYTERIPAAIEGIIRSLKQLK